MQTIIPKNQAIQRWDTLPQEIRDAMFSDKNADTLDRAYTGLHVPADQRKFVSLVVSYVFMGFIHLEDMAKEIETALAMNSLHARELADAINQGVFAPYREILEKIYTGKPEAAPARPSFDSVVAPKAAIPVSATAPKSLESLSAKPSATPAAIPENKPAPAPAMPAFTTPPAALPNLSAFPAKPAAMPLPASTASSAPTPAPAPAPFVIQTETKVQPVAQAPKFSMESLGKVVSAFGTRGPASMAAPKNATVEIGSLPERATAPSGVVGKYESSPRVIHYGGPSTPLPGAPAPSPSAPVSMGSLQGSPSSRPSPAPSAPSPSFAPSPAKPSAPVPPGAGGFIKTMITPKNETLGTGPIPAPPAQK